MPQKKSFAIFVLLLATIIAFLVGAELLDLPKYYQIDKNGAKTQGVVISKERENHMYIGFEYEVGNKKFQSGGYAEDINKSFDSIELNEKIPVYYDPSAPEASTLGNPDKQLRTSLWGVCFISLVPLLLFLGYRLKKKFA